MKKLGVCAHLQVEVKTQKKVLKMHGTRPTLSVWERMQLKSLCNGKGPDLRVKEQHREREKVFARQKCSNIMFMF